MSREPEPGDRNPPSQPSNPWVSQPADAAPAAPEAAAAAPPPQGARTSGPRWRLGALAAGAAGAAIVLGVALATTPLWWPAVVGVIAGPSRQAAEQSADLIARLEQLETVQTTRAGQDAAQLDALARRIKDIEERVESLRRLAQSAEAGPAVGALADRVARIETETGALGEVAQRVRELEAQAGAGASAESAAVDALDKRLGALSERLNQMAGTRTAEGDDRAARAAVLALGQVRERVRQGQPFAAELSALAALWPDSQNEPMSALRAHAETGVPTVEALKQRFQAAATAALRAGAEPGQGWLDRVGGWMRSLVVVRPEAGALPPGNTAEAIITRAETRLRAGELAAAIAELGLLAPAAAQPFAAWVDGARALQAVGNALAALEIQAIARLGRS